MTPSSRRRLNHPTRGRRRRLKGKASNEKTTDSAGSDCGRDERVFLVRLPLALSPRCRRGSHRSLASSFEESQKVRVALVRVVRPWDAPG